MSVHCERELRLVFVILYATPAPAANLIHLPSTMTSRWFKMRLEQLSAFKSGSYQVFLREASILVPPLVKSKEWNQELGLMQSNSFQTFGTSENGHTI